MLLGIQTVLEQTKNKTILVVEDEPFELKYLTRLFQSLFAEVYSASNGEDALAIYFEKKPSLVITDITMPKLSGIQLIEKIYEDDPHIPLFILSAHTEERIYLDAMYAGASCFLFKPLNMDELYKNLFMHLSRLEKVQELKKQDILFSALYKHAPKGIVLVDAQTNAFIEFNTYAHEILGYTQEEYSALSFTDIEAPQSPDAVEKYKRDILTQGSTIYNARHYRKDGTILDVSVLAIYLEIENTPCYLVTCTDISEIKQKEYELQETLKEAEKLNHTKDIFLANMSHEIRTPLNGIIGIIDLLGQSDLDLEQKKLLEIVQNSSSVLKHLINDILDYSKLEAGKLELEKIQFNPFKLLDQVVKLFENEAKNKDITLSLDHSIDPKITLYGDPNRYTQILNNLVGNALKFTENGHVKLKTKYRVEGEQNVLEVHIIDTGIGMDREQLSRLFTPFEQASLSHTRRYGGTGLGLTISKQFANMMDGDITVDSHLGMGSCFSLIIPFESVNEAFMEESVLDTELTLKSPNKYNILVVDDSEVNLMVATGYLEQFGLTCKTAENGLQAIEKVKETKFDLIFMDIHMPLLNGLDASIEIKKIDPSIPIVALSAAAMPQEKELALQIGINDYLTKPIDTEMLNKILKRYLSTIKTPQEQLNQNHSLNIYGIDMEELLKKLGKKERVEKFLTLFKNEFTEMKNLFSTLEIGSEELNSAIHHLKGSAGNGSMQHLYALCLEFESQNILSLKEQTLGLLKSELEMILESISKERIFL